MTAGIVLASTSPFRAALLRNAGVAFRAEDPAIDENPIKSSMVDRQPADIALALAEAKALSVAARLPDALVIGSDQVLVHDGVVFDKPADLPVARVQLMRLRAAEHSLLTAVCTARGRHVRWSFIDEARLTMRPFSEEFLDHYLAQVGETVCRSVGGYQVEGLGAQLFSQIAGDHFTILGLPLLPLLEHLRREGAVEA